MVTDFAFAWEGANHPDGPWNHLRVAEFHGREALSTLYSFELELVRFADAPDVEIADLIGRRATLRIATETKPSTRFIHGVIASVEELGEMDKGTRYRVVLAPPLVRATMMKKSIIYLDKTLQQIIEAVLTRTSWGAGLVPSRSQPHEDDGHDVPDFKPATATFAMRVLDMSRLADDDVRPYCVQYDESDFAFISRLLEEEGISYHFEHTNDECIFVMSDFDGGRHEIAEKNPLGPGFLGREVHAVRVGTRLRPRSISLNDYNWRKPELELLAQSPAGLTDFHTHEHPARYEQSKQMGERLAEKRQERLDTEREWAAAEGRCRLLGAGSVFTLEHPNAKWGGRYLVTSITHAGRERASGSQQGDSGSEPYVNRFEAIRCHPEDGSHFRPERVTPRPRIMGSQTAIVTAEPTAPDAEINVGGPENIGCIRVRFHWDIDTGRLEKEPSSCWIRVGQLFAGAAGHGALWNPRVGEEVIVDFLDGDPDRPLITGRVYNGKNLPPENPTQRPTWSAIRSMTSPHDGNYNMIAFEDAAGKEQIVMHAARDHDVQVVGSASRSVGADDSATVGGSQSVSVTGAHSISAGSISASGSTTVSLHAGTDLSANAGATLTASGKTFVGSAGENMSLEAGANASLVAAANLTLSGNITDVVGQGNVNMEAPWIDVRGEAKVRIGAGLVEVNGSATVLVNAGASIAIKGGAVTISGSTVTVQGGGTVNVNGGMVNLNC